VLLIFFMMTMTVDSHLSEIQGPGAGMLHLETNPGVLADRHRSEDASTFTHWGLGRGPPPEDTI